MDDLQNSKNFDVLRAEKHTKQIDAHLALDRLNNFTY